jgi:hypothetical protein
VLAGSFYLQVAMPFGNSRLDEFFQKARLNPMAVFHAGNYKRPFFGVHSFVSEKNSSQVSGVRCQGKERFAF